MKSQKHSKPEEPERDECFDVFNDYSGLETYKHINFILLHGDEEYRRAFNVPHNDKTTVENYHSKIKQMDKCFQLSPKTETEMVLYRGMDRYLDLTDSTPVLLKNFTSTTKRIDIAKGFSKKIYTKKDIQIEGRIARMISVNKVIDDCCIYCFHVDKGISYIDMEKISKIRGEHEILLPRDLYMVFMYDEKRHSKLRNDSYSYNVKHVRISKSPHSKTIIEMTILPKSTNQLKYEEEKLRLQHEMHDIEMKKQEAELKHNILQLEKELQRETAEKKRKDTELKRQKQEQQKLEQEMKRQKIEQEAKLKHNILQLEKELQLETAEKKRKDAELKRQKQEQQKLEQEQEMKRQEKEMKRQKLELERQKQEIKQQKLEMKRQKLEQEQELKRQKLEQEQELKRQKPEHKKNTTVKVVYKKTDYKRCPKGTRKNKNGICETTAQQIERKMKEKLQKDKIQKEKQIPTESKRKRCPNGSRKNKNGDCVPVQSK